MKTISCVGPAWQQGGGGKKKYVEEADMLDEKIGREIRERNTTQTYTENKKSRLKPEEPQKGEEWRPPKHICSSLMALSYEYRHRGALF